MARERTRPRLLVAKLMYEDQRRAVGPESHECHELVQVIDGSYLVHVDGVDYRSEPGDILYYPPGVWHNATIVRGPIALVQWQERRGDVAAADRPRRSRDPTGRLVTVINWLCDLRYADDPSSRHMESDLLDVLVRQLARQSDAPHHDPIHRVRAHIAYHLDENLGLDDLAALAGMSRSTLARRFRRVMGCTPMAYLRRLRCEAAGNLLRATDLPLKAIAEQVGLASASHLAHLVKRLDGRTPGEIRQGTDHVANDR